MTPAKQLEINDLDDSTTEFHKLQNMLMLNQPPEFYDVMGILQRIMQNDLEIVIYQDIDNKYDYSDPPWLYLR